ncbi:MAG: replicative DNA helicase [Candidatus Omnitrophica bacterium]|nr:replicative DNA helicase [Candidatus Omnitrophota bacterium]MDD5610100.1 replicative DNA helicase [Candidatus Omnitrophota bacterium]
MPSEAILEKIPPQNLEAEMAVLGAMLLDEEAVACGIELLDRDCFYKDAHKKIFEAAIDIYNNNKAVDLITISDELKKRGELEEIGGVSFLTQLVNTVPTTANTQHYAKIIKEKSILRSLINNATQIVSLGYESEADIQQVLDRAEQMIFDIADRKPKAAITSLKEVVKASIETIDKLYQKKTHVTGIPSGYVEFDIKTAGLHPSDLTIVAGRPSMGKSALALGIAEHVSINEKMPVAFFSLEMSKEQLVQRLLCTHARVDAQRVRTGYFSQSDWPKLTAAAGKLSEAPLFIDDTPGLSVLELRAKARRLKSKHDIQLIILDYMQLMRGSISRIDSRQEEISEISRSLKALARELNLPLIAVSQLSRAVESRNDHRPQLSDLRESGAIEQDADVVALLLREEYYNPTPENQGIAEVNIAKQRNGPVGSVKLTFIKEYTRFENLSRVEE